MKGIGKKRRGFSWMGSVIFMFAALGIGPMGQELEAQPKITVSQDAVELPDGTGTFDFGPTILKSPTPAVTFLIASEGTEPLILSANPKVSLSGLDPTMFVMMTQPATTIHQGTTQVFRIVFIPTKLGLCSAIVTIANNDPAALTYTFNVVGTSTYPPRVGLPVFSPDAGRFDGPQDVRLAAPTQGATIYFTTDGSAPSHDPNGLPQGTTRIYAEPIHVGSSLRIRSAARKEFWFDSDVSEASYDLRPNNPVLTPGSASFTTAQKIGISTETAGARILYTEDGSSPSHDSDGNPTNATKLYGGPIDVQASELVKAISFLSGYPDSDVVSAEYTLIAEEPEIKPDALTSNQQITITITAPTQGADIYYTTDGSPPTRSSNRYSAPFKLTRSATVSAIAAKYGWSNSGVRQKTYSLKTDPPSISLDSGSYGLVDHKSPLVAILPPSTATDAKIRYVIGNEAESPPTAAIGTAYGGPFHLPSMVVMTLKAVAYKDGWTPSDVAIRKYSLKIPHFVCINRGPRTGFLNQEKNSSRLILSSTYPSGGFYAAATDGTSRCVAVGPWGECSYSSNGGVTWARPQFISRDNLNGVAYGEKRWVLVGAQGIIRYSDDDGATWTSAASGTTAELHGVAYVPSTPATPARFIAVGASTILYSSDKGATWSPASIGFPATLYRAAYSKETKRVVAVGLGGVIVYSDDAGKTWKAGSSGTKNHLHGIAFGAGTWLATGLNGEIRSSIDNGMTWSKTSSGTGNYLLGVGYSSGFWVTLGRYNTILYSTDAIHWSTVYYPYNYDYYDVVFCE